MPNDRGWTNSPTTVLCHRVVNWINAHPEDGPFYMTDAAAEGMGADPASVAEIFDLFETAGWGETQRYLGSKYTAEIMINGAGKAVLREYAEQSRARGRQINACTDALLDWLYEHDGERVSSSDFATDPRANYLGEPFDASIIREAAKSLKDQGLSTGTGTMQGVMLRMSITPAGRDVVDAFGSDVRAWRTRELTGRQGDVNVRVDGSSAVTVAVHSPGASQTATVTTTDHRTQIIGLADAFEQTLPVLGLSGGDQEEAERLIVELRQIGEDDEPEPGRIRKLLDGVKSMAVVGTGNAAGTGIVALAEQIAQNWPL
jgi:hypothetical protein